tara:strand:+ start:27 stop:401 length:375 start_codon:yes stop_codon:yes gene_type:complete
MSEQQTISCSNCYHYGVYDIFGNLSIPCTNCAEDNSWTWDGKKCYGSMGQGAENSIQNLVMLKYVRVRPRLIKSVPAAYPNQGLFNTEQEADEHILKSLPEEAREPYAQYVEERRIEEELLKAM